MKLNLLFIVMDLLTLLAYPIVYAYGTLRPFAVYRIMVNHAHVTASIYL